MKKTNLISDVSKHYSIDFKKIIQEINKKNFKRILLQFPEGLKMHSTNILDFLKTNTQDKEFFIWLDTCYGACDTPLEIKEKGIDLIIHIGHNELQPQY
ncbi:MAG: diphthamide synthesis protein [Nanoarchaeota archaeon]